MATISARQLAVEQLWRTAESARQGSADARARLSSIACYWGEPSLAAAANRMLRTLSPIREVVEGAEVVALPERVVMAPCDTGDVA